MSLGILRPGFGDCPNSACEIEFLPLQTGNLFTALAGERQELNDATIWTADLSSGKDNSDEFLVIEHSVSSNLLRGQWHSFGW
jgi:hypothetical protein